MKNDTSQFSLFTETDHKPEQLICTDGEVRVFRCWLPSEQAATEFQSLMTELQWQQSLIRIAGRQLPIPRLNAWYGDPGCHYSYSGIGFDPLTWTATLARLRAQLQLELGVTFNSVLANLYRDGRDSVSWHSDNERELGPAPVIASLSFGAERRFHLKHKTRHELAPIVVSLPTGSLLVMAGVTQRYWVHQIAKTRQIAGPRINLTFRFIEQAFAARV